jgi:phage-related tail fiber protein
LAAIPFLYNIDLNSNEIQNVVIQNLASDPVSPVEGQIWYNTTGHQLKYRNNSATVILYSAASANTASTLVLRDSSGDFSAHDITANKVTGLATPSGSSDAATKAYVDAAINGLDWKASVRVASTANVTIASELENGDTIDGVTLATGDRVLLKDQSTASQNGIYVVVASGAASRATDCDADAEVTGGFAVWVNEGTANGDTGWVLTTNDPITVGSTSLTFTQFNSGSVTAGAGLTKTGSTIDVGTASTSRIVVNADNIDLATTGISAGTYTSITIDVYGRATAGADIITSNGIVVRTASSTFTNRSVAAGTGISVTNGDGVSGNPTVAIDTSVVVRKYATDIGDNSSTSITVTHNLGTRDVVVQLRDNSSPYGYVFANVSATTTNTVTVDFAVAPASNKYRCIVHA